MKQATTGLLMAVVALLLTGCMSVNRIVGHKITETGNWYGELGITGHVNDITVQSDSRLHKLSILGDGNKVMVEDRATLGKIEIWGENNTVSIPEWLVVRMNQTGQGNRVMRRARTGTRTTQPPAMYEPAPAYDEPYTTESESPAPVTSYPPASSQTETYTPAPAQEQPPARRIETVEPMQMQPVE